MTAIFELEDDVVYNRDPKEFILLLLSTSLIMYTLIVESPYLVIVHTVLLFARFCYLNTFIKHKYQLYVYYMTIVYMIYLCVLLLGNIVKPMIPFSLVINIGNLMLCSFNMEIKESYI